MKRIICLLTVLTLCISLCACSTIVDDAGVERRVLYDRFVVIEKNWDMNIYIAWDKDTHVVYYLKSGSSGFMSPYLIYTEEGLCGAIYEDGRIQPIHFVTAKG